MYDGKNLAEDCAKILPKLTWVPGVVTHLGTSLGGAIAPLPNGYSIAVGVIPGEAYMACVELHGVPTTALRFHRELHALLPPIAAGAREMFHQFAIGWQNAAAMLDTTEKKVPEPPAPAPEPVVEVEEPRVRRKFNRSVLFGREG